MYDIVEENGISIRKRKDKPWIEHQLKDYKKQCTYQGINIKGTT